MASQLTKSERALIKHYREVLLYSWRKIAYYMNRSHTSLMREYSRNKKKWSVYDSDGAHHKSLLRRSWKRKQSKKIVMNTELENDIVDKLQYGWSPEIIAWRMKANKEIYSWTTISSSSIRRYIHSKHAYHLKQLLIQNKLIRSYKKKAKHGKRQWWCIKYRVFIDARPLHVSCSTELWHCECDFIESTKWDTTVILVLIDKYSRFRYAIMLADKKSYTVYQALMYCIKEYGLKTITFDNDLWFAWHYRLWIPTYFCHTYSSREKWQIEVSNRWYRFFFPKKTPLSHYTQTDIDKATHIINHRPMKCLNYKTPIECVKEQEHKAIYRILS